MIHRLVYSSRCADGVGEADVRDILETARQENAKADTTGILFLVNNEFLQVLEGPLSVYGLFDRISKDPRHHSVELHVEEETPTRSHPLLYPRRALRGLRSSIGQAHETFGVDEAEAFIADDNKFATTIK